MGELNTESYSRPIIEAGAAFDRYQKLEAAQKDAQAKLKAATQARQRTTDIEELNRLSQQVAWLSELVTDLEKQKNEAMKAVTGFTEEHQKGQELMGKTDSKWIN